MIAALVTSGRPTLLVSHRQHRGVFAGAIVVETRRAATILTHDFGAALGRRIVRATGEIAFFHADVAKHSFDDRDVLGLAPMGRAGHRELFVAPAERVETAVAEEWDDLEW